MGRSGQLCGGPGGRDARTRRREVEEVSVKGEGIGRWRGYKEVEEVEGLEGSEGKIGKGV